MSQGLLQKRWPWLAAAALIAGAYLASLSIHVGGGDPRPAGGAEDIAKVAERKDVNVLFILVDTLRAERLGSYGYARDTSPTLDLLARTGVRFTRQLAQSSWTKCSMASLWTSLYPAHNGVTRFDQVIPPEATLPAEILKEGGFRTVGIYRNGWVAPNFGFGQGFDVYDRPRGGPVPPSVRRENPTLKEGGSDDDAVNAAIEFLRLSGDQRWLLYLHLMDVHEYLYDDESAVFGTSYSDIYDNSILHLDRILDRLLAYLAGTGQMQRTIVVLAADHGEAFGERGFEGHAREVYRETTEVPWIIAFPFRLDPLGLPALPRSDGRSRMPEILAAARGEAAPAEAEETAIAHIDRFWGRPLQVAAPVVAVSEDGLRYVSVRGGGTRDSEQLFDAKTDPLERQDLAAHRPDDAERLRKVADAYLESPPVWNSAPPTLELDEIQLNQLRALGYALP
jgi:sulfatase-like protein